VLSQSDGAPVGRVGLPGEDDAVEERRGPVGGRVRQLFGLGLGRLDLVRFLGAAGDEGQADERGEGGELKPEPASAHGEPQRRTQAGVARRMLSMTS
jgi:hypothetical protein